MKNVTLKLYENARHEVINEINRDIVYNDVLNWLMEQNNILAQDSIGAWETSEKL